MNKNSVVIIGAGKGSINLLEILHELENVNILAVIDKDLNAPGIKFAKSLGITVDKSWKDYINNPFLTVVMNVTGDNSLTKELEKYKSETVSIMECSTAYFFWDIISELRKIKQLENQYFITKRQLKNILSDDNFVLGKSKAMRHVQDLIAKVAPTPTTVLLRGETGTGKEMIARAIYNSSLLKNNPFITINCTALTSTLMESELFGYKKGAFTGALQDRKGLLVEADGGTIFLDEIGDMNLELQAKLLRFLQTGEVRPVGSNDIHYVNVRIIAATNRDLEKAIEEGEFRNDLFYRFNTFTINMSPLRERLEDLPELAYKFLLKAEAKLNKIVENISSSALETMSQYNWPGNVRELENVIERAVILCTGDTILPEHLPLQVQYNTAKFVNAENFKEQKDNYEKNAIINFINQANGNITKASEFSGIPRRTFYRLLKRYNIKRKA